MVINVTVPPASVSSLAIATPSAVILPPDNTGQYETAGGVSPFTDVASNPIVMAAATGADTLCVTAANPGTSTIVVYDRNGTSTKFELAVSGATEFANLYTTALESFFMPSKATAT